MATEYDGIIAELARIGDLIEGMRSDAQAAQNTALANMAAQTAALESLDLSPPPAPELPQVDSVDPRPFQDLPPQSQVQALPADGRLFVFPNGSLLRWTAEGFLFCGSDGLFSEIVFTDYEHTLPDGLVLTLDADHAHLIQTAPDEDDGETPPEPPPVSYCDQCGLVHEEGSHGL